MKLVQINFSHNVGSTGKIAEQIGELAIARGWESYILSGRQINTSKLQSIRINNRLELLWHIFFTHFADMDGLCSYFATKRLVKQLKKLSPNIVHLHVIHESYINYPVLFKYLKEANIPVVWTFHDCWALTGHCPHFDYIGCDKWKTECHNCPCSKNYKKLEFFIRARYNHQLKKQYFASLDKLTIVPVSVWLEGLVRQSFLSSKNICTIKNGIDLQVFKPSPSNIRERLNAMGSFVVMGCAGNWGKMKGEDDFIEIARRHPDWRFIMVGIPQSKLYALPQNVHGVPFTNGQQELAEYYSIADVFVNPTYQDTYPTTNLEAIACGTPVITYNSGGSPETIDSHCGISVERGDIDALDKAIIHIQKLGKKYYSDACIIRAKEHFDKNQKYQEYLTLYSRLLDNESKNEKV